MNTINNHLIKIKEIILKNNEIQSEYQLILQVDDSSKLIIFKKLIRDNIDISNEITKRYILDDKQTLEIQNIITKIKTIIINKL
jgi:hypothetical protein